MGLSVTDQVPLEAGLEAKCCPETWLGQLSPYPSLRLGLGHYLDRAWLATSPRQRAVAVVLVPRIGWGV